MEPLPDAWKKPQYGYQEALRIVAWARYGAPHPGTDAKPSREARWNADRDIQPLMKRETIERPAPVRRVRYVSTWDSPWGSTGFGKPGRGLADNRPPPRPVSYTVPWLPYEALLTLCPGIFTEEPPGGTDAPQRGRPPTLNDAVDMAESLMAGGAIQKRAALVAAQHYFPDEAEKKAGSIERQLRARRKRNGQ